MLSRDVFFEESKDTISETQVPKAVKLVEYGFKLYIRHRSSRKIRKSGESFSGAYEVVEYEIGNSNSKSDRELG